MLKLLMYCRLIIPTEMNMLHQLVVPGTPPEGVEGRQFSTFVFFVIVCICPHILVCAVEVWLPSAVSSKFMFSQVSTTIYVSL